MTKTKKSLFLGTNLDEIIKGRESWDSASFSDLFHEIKKELVEKIRPLAQPLIL